MKEYSLGKHPMSIAAYSYYTRCFCCFVRKLIFRIYLCSPVDRGVIYGRSVIEKLRANFFGLKRGASVYGYMFSTFGVAAMIGILMVNTL